MVVYLAEMRGHRAIPARGDVEEGGAVDRRRVLKSLLVLLGSALSVSLIYPLVRYLAPPSGAEQGGKVTIKKSEVEVGSSKDIVVRNIPAIVINTPDKGFIALSKVCTHLGCLVQYEKSKNRLLCPCHGGVYNLEGAVISGPPPKPLQKFTVKVEGDSVVIG